MSVISKLKKQCSRRKLRVRKNLRMFHNNNKVRVSVFRSLKYTSAQVIDDSNQVTVLSCSTKALGSHEQKMNKVDAAYQVGLLLGKKLLDKQYSEIVFDRGVYLYSGRVKSFADGIRAAGIKF